MATYFENNHCKNKRNSGERLYPTMLDETALEHLHRYAIATEFITEKKILDIACGEGYGTLLLSLKAKHITGADINEETIKKAVIKYKRDNLNFIHSEIINLPFPEQSFDTITCFETIEHTINHQEVIKELKRVLKNDGVLIISTPDKKNYSEKNNYSNPFHLIELYENDFKELIQTNFNYSTFYKQSKALASIITSDTESPLTHSYTGNFNWIEKKEIIEPLYWIAIASDSPVPERGISSLFYNNKMTEKYMEYLRFRMKETISYKLGHFLLWPFKKIKKIFFSGQ